MKKLTEDWKIKKRKSSCCSFKEAIDFKLASPESILPHVEKGEISITPKRKASKDHSISKRDKAQRSQSQNISLTPLRRSTRLTNKSIRQKEVIVKSQLSENLTRSAIESQRVEQKSFEVKNLSKNEDNGCNLSQWGLPPSVVQAYNSRNVNTMFQWQYECLLMKNVLDGGNLVFSAPTSAGKTLVAEILMLKSVTETKKKAIMILPFVSVVREKVNYFQEMFENAGIVVDGYMGAHNPPGGFKSVDVAICTIEKANNLVNRLMEERRLGEVGILVVDELHMLGDHSRGYLLELLLTKLLYNCKRNNIQIQIVGMSATLPNLNVLSFWLGSELYRTDFRPVPLFEMVKVGSIIYDAKSMAASRDLKLSGVTFKDDADHTILLSIETIAAGHGVLIFCPSKNWCENLATSIAKEVYTVGRPREVADGNVAYNAIGEKLRENLNGSQLNDILLQLKSSPAGLDSVLGLTVPFGVAFHHAGLTFDERDIIEGAFRQGIIKILVATSTLSSGVNLPARRVIIRSPLFCGSVIDVLSYKQMVGRAGRKGIDSEGESILICKETERNVALTLVNSELRPVKSCLLKSGSSNLHSSLKRALIEVIASGVASTQKEVLQYLRCTLLFASLAKENESSDNDVESSIEKCVGYLVDNEIIFKHEEKDDEGDLRVLYKPTRLGLAILASGFSPDDALRILKELQLARRCFVLENDLHILYEVTPPYLSDQMGQLNWMHFLSLWEDLPEEYKRVGELVGVQENFIGLGIQGRLNRNNSAHKMAVHQRFYATLALNDLIQEVPLPVVAKKYDCTRGVLQSLQQSTSTFAGMLTIFCNRLGWHNLELLFSSFQKRVHFGVQQELCDLVRLSTLNAQRARALYNAGFESISSLASASAEELSLLLCNMGAFESAKQLDGALAEEALQRHEAKRIRITGKAGVNEREAANLIIQEAQNFIRLELGISSIHWKHTAAQKFVKEKESEPGSSAQPPSTSGIGQDMGGLSPKLTTIKNAAENDTESNVSGHPVSTIGNEQEMKRADQKEHKMSKRLKAPAEKENVKGSQSLKSNQSVSTSAVGVDLQEIELGHKKSKKSITSDKNEILKVTKFYTSSNCSSTSDVLGDLQEVKELDHKQAKRSNRTKLSDKNEILNMESSQSHISNPLVSPSFVEDDLQGSRELIHKSSREVKKTSKSKNSIISAMSKHSVSNSRIDVQRIEKNDCKKVSVSNESKVIKVRKNTSEDSEESVLNLNDYPKILQQMYTDTNIKKDVVVSLNEKNYVTLKSPDVLLNSALHEDGFEEDKEKDSRKKVKNLNRKEVILDNSTNSNAILSESLYGNLEDALLEDEALMVFSDSVMGKRESSVSSVKFTSGNKDSIHLRSKPLNETFLAEEMENISSVPGKESVNLKNESLSCNIDDRFCTLLASQTSSGKLENEEVCTEGLLGQMDHFLFSELLLSQIADADDVYFTQSFNVHSNKDINGVISKVPNDNILGKDNVLSPIAQPLNETVNSQLLPEAKAEELQCVGKTNRCSLLDESEFNFMSESRFSFELKSSFHCKEQVVEKNSTPITEMKSKIKQNVLSNTTSKDRGLKTVSPLNTYSTPVKLPNNESFNEISNNHTFHTLERDKNVTIPRIHIVPLLDAKIPQESPIQFEKGHSVNETSGDIFEFEESFNTECVSSQKECEKLICNTKKDNLFNDNVLKTNRSLAETSGDIFEDSFDIQKLSFDIETNIHSNKNMIKDDHKIKNKQKDENISNFGSKCHVIANNGIHTEPNNIIHSKFSNCEWNGKSINKKRELEGNIKVMNKKSDIKEYDTNLELLNVKDQSQFWNSWNSQDNLTLPDSVHEAQVDLSEKLPNFINRPSPLRDKGNLTLDSADNSLFNSFNSDCLSPTPDKPSKSSLKIQISSRRMSSGHKLFGHNDSFRDCVKKTNFCPSNKENNNSLNLSTESEVNLQVTQISDSQLENFLKRTTKIKKFALSVACEKIVTKHRTIGPIKNTKGCEASKYQLLVDPDIAVVGLAISYGKDSFYICCSEDKDMDGSCSSLPLSEKNKMIQQFFLGCTSEKSVIAYDTKSQYKILWQGFNISLKQKCADPSIAAWLLDPAKGQQSLKALVNDFWPEAAHLMEDFDNTGGSLGLQTWSTISGKERAATEAYVTFHLMDKLLNILKEQKLHKAFTELEMPSVLSFAKMEQNGLGFDTFLATNFQKELQKKQQDILDKAYQVAGRRFNILSSREVSKILFKELKLSPVLAPDSPLIKKHLGAGKAPRSRRMPPELKTNRECLEKIIHLHPLPKAILDWRRLSFATTKVLMPLLRERKHDQHFNMDRLYSTCFYYTVTGRVNVHSPNLQFIPRDFNIDYTAGEGDNHSDAVDYQCSDEDILQYGVSLRNLFIPSKGNILLAADYTQLELRILAHLSNEKKLLESLNCDEDVFKNIASKWKNIPITSVSNDLRQQAKKICYGMIYGMSANSLAQQLNTTKEEASLFMETFKKSYPGLNKYFQSVIEKCQKNGFVTTLMQRRRYLPMINSQNKSERTHAERQAINTTIQGSAADIIKAAMIKIETELQKMFPETAEPFSSFQNTNSKPKTSRGGFLVLQMHDELIYEVNRNDLQIVLSTVQKAMETTTRLTVKLPVQVRYGASWGNMKEVS